MGNILNIINSDEHFHDVSDFGRNNYMRCLEGAFLSSEIKAKFNTNVVNINNINNNLKYIYLI